MMCDGSMLPGLCGVGRQVVELMERSGTRIVDSEGPVGRRKVRGIFDASRCLEDFPQRYLPG